ncbi:restriction endonuclease subunit S [Staphylococcus epidermidis]|nr:restriction endonuclease subunit S [Staphylococcus epidermidis]MCG1135319.1 restriction endonuclease subunit S [Staphylococcus epidermidis]
MIEHTNTPELRFPEFTEEWEITLLGEVSYITKLAGFEFTKYVNYSNEGKIPAIRGINIKNGRFNFEDVKYIDDSDFSKLSRSKLLPQDIVFTYVGTIGHAAIVPNDTSWYLAPNVAKIRSTNVYPDFLLQILTNPTFKRKEIFSWITTSSQPALSMANIRNFKLYLPSILEQKKVGIFFSKLDQQIELEEKKLELLEQQKRGYIQQLYSQEIRFKDDKGENYPEWKLTELNAIFTKYKNTIYLKDEQEYKRISISNRGIISHRDITLGKEIGRKRQYVIDLNNHPNTLTFIRQGVFLGGIGFVPKFLNNYIVTENMPLLSMDSKYNKLFMTYLFESEDYYKNVIFKNLPIGSAQKALHEKEWLQSTVSVPILEEQEKIGNFFNKTDNLIELQTKKIESLKQRKRGLLQKMFV